MNAALALLAVGCAALDARGQSWSVTASAPVPGTASASLTILPSGSQSQPATMPAGPLAAGPFFVASVGSGLTHANVGATWSASVPGQVGPLAFAASSSWSGAMHGVLAGFAAASLNAQVDVTLRSPQPTSGRLRLRTAPNPAVLSAPHTIAVDLGADGTVDYQVHASALADLPLTIPAHGAVLRLSFVITALLGGGTASGELGVTAEFFPGEPVVSVFDTTGMGTSLHWQATPGQVALTLGAPADTPLLLVFGAQAISVPLFPTVTALVTLDAFYATGAMVLPAVPLPPGTAIHVQGLVLDVGGTLRSSNSVRALWP